MLGRSKRGTSNLAAKNRELVAKHHELELPELLGAAAKRDELKQAS
jgi:hypothetical protein